MLYLDTSEINQRQQHLCSSPVHLTHLLTAQWDIGIALDGNRRASKRSGHASIWPQCRASLCKWEQQLLSPGHKLESTCHQE